jgi:hypothetical protein
MGYRSRRIAARSRLAAIAEQLLDAERQARTALGGALPYLLEARLARLEPMLVQLDDPSDAALDDGDALLVALREVGQEDRRPRNVDDAFIRVVRGSLVGRRRERAKTVGTPRTHELRSMLRRIDPDAQVLRRHADTSTNGGAVEARLRAHGCPLYFAGQLGREIDGMLATPMPRSAARLRLKPYRWWRRMAGAKPATLGHAELDDRFTLDGCRDSFDDELCNALADLCRFDEPTLVVAGATATINWSYDVAYEPLAAAARVLAALRHRLAPIDARRDTRPPPQNAGVPNGTGSRNA